MVQDVGFDVLNTVYGFLGIAALAAVGLLALVRGGAGERYAAAVAALGWIASLAMQGASGIHDPLFGFLIIDLAAFFALLELVWRSHRRWPLFAVSFQGLAASIDLVRISLPRLHPWFYLTALALAGYGLLVCIGFGAWRAGRPSTPVLPG